MAGSVSPCRGMTYTDVVCYHNMQSQYAVVHNIAGHRNLVILVSSGKKYFVKLQKNASYHDTGGGFTTGGTVTVHGLSDANVCTITIVSIVSTSNPPGTQTRVFVIHHIPNIIFWHSDHILKSKIMCPHHMIQNYWFLKCSVKVWYSIEVSKSDIA